MSDHNPNDRIYIRSNKPADELDGPAVDEMEFDNDPDTLESDEFEDSEESGDFD